MSNFFYSAPNGLPVFVPALHSATRHPTSTDIRMWSDMLFRAAEAYDATEYLTSPFEEDEPFSEKVWMKRFILCQILLKTVYYPGLELFAGMPFTKDDPAAIYSWIKLHLLHYCPPMNSLDENLCGCFDRE